MGGAKPSSAPPPGRRPPAVRRAFSARRAPGPRLPCRPLSLVQASERPRTPVRPRAAGPTRAPSLLACNAAELGSRPGEGSARPYCPSRHPPWGLNTDCRRPHPGPAQDRLAGRGPGLEALGANAWRPLWLLGKHGDLRGEGQGPRSDQVPELHGSPATPNLRLARPGGNRGSALPVRGPPPPGPPVCHARYARHTAPALRSAPRSRGAGAGGPKPSWP